MFEGPESVEQVGHLENLKADSYSWKMGLMKSVVEGELSRNKVGAVYQRDQKEPCTTG